MLETTEWMLVGVCLLGSLISVSIGTSCGLLFAAMVTVLPPTTALALHGFIEGISSGIRWAMLHRHVSYRYLGGFMAGGIVGLFVGWPLIGLFSDQVLLLILGLFLLATLWLPLAWLKLSSFTGGASTSCLTVLVGATGPLVAALLARKAHSHRTVIATQGACTLFQHWGKVVVFALSGFSFAQHLSLLLALSMATIVGTLMGKNLLNLIPSHYLGTALRVVVTLLGLRMLLRGLELDVSDTPILSFFGIACALLLVAVSCYSGYRIAMIKSRES